MKDQQQSGYCRIQTFPLVSFYFSFALYILNFFFSLVFLVFFYLYNILPCWLRSGKTKAIYLRKVLGPNYYHSGGE